MTAPAPTAAFCRSDIRFHVLEACARALFPGAVLVPIYDDADKADLDEAGNIKATAVPQRIELRFMPPPGLRFDQRDPLYAIELLKRVADESCAAIMSIKETEEAQGLGPPLEEALESRRWTPPT